MSVLVLSLELYVFAAYVSISFKSGAICLCCLHMSVLVLSLGYTSLLCILACWPVQLSFAGLRHSDVLPQPPAQRQGPAAEVWRSSVSLPSLSLVQHGQLVGIFFDCGPETGSHCCPEEDVGH